MVGNGKENKIQLIKIITRCLYCKNPRWPPGASIETTKCHNFCYERPMIMFLVSMPRFLGVRNPFLHFAYLRVLSIRKSNIRTWSPGQCIGVSEFGSGSLLNTEVVLLDERQPLGQLRNRFRSFSEPSESTVIGTDSEMSS